MKAKPTKSPSSKKKRPSGYAQAKASGKVVVMLQLTPDQAAVIDLAATHEGRSRTNYIAHHAYLTASQHKETT